MVVTPAGCSQLQKTLQAAVQSIQWTYSLFWQLCPDQGMLVWGDGYYNGAIKTRKMVQHMEVSLEEASLQRSQQLRELYDSLSAGEATQSARRPCAALSPEDLTESEWFYLMCMSFSFPPGVGLPGKAFAKRRHVWLVRANQADSKHFSRAILAKSAQIQTVVCIPVMDGVLELGNIEKVEEDARLVQHAMSFFMDFHDINAKSTLSEHSTSSPTAYITQPLLQTHTFMHKMTINALPGSSSKEDDQGDDNNEDDDEEEEGDEEDDDEDDEEEVEASSKTELEPRNYSVEIPMAPPNLVPIEETVPIVEASELMQVDMSEGIRMGSPDECSTELDVELEMFRARQGANNAQKDSRRREDGEDDDAYRAWNFIHDDLCKSLEQPSGTQGQDLSPEDAHYSETVASILQCNVNRWSGSSCFSGLVYEPHKSAFSEWNRKTDCRFGAVMSGSSQWLLKKILVSLPNFQNKYRRDEEGGAKFQKGSAQEEPSANHVLAERRRREKLNERFIVLRSLVPFVTKMDKASILGDTIEYVKQLRKRIQDLEARNKEIESRAQEIDNTSNSRELNIVNSKSGNNRKLSSSEKKKMRVDVGTSTGIRQSTSTNLQVSIIESNALLELQCQYKEGLLLKIMKTLDELRLEVTSIQSSTINGTFIGELRAKVKETQGKRVSIIEVKKAIYQIFS